MTPTTLSSNLAESKTNNITPLTTRAILVNLQGEQGGQSARAKAGIGAVIVIRKYRSKRSKVSSSNPEEVRAEAGSNEVREMDGENDIKEADGVGIRAGNPEVSADFSSSSMSPHSACPVTNCYIRYLLITNKL